MPGIEQTFPNTGSAVNVRAPNTGLSTQIIIKVSGTAVGALQRLTVTQNRPLERIKEVGTDGVIEIVPNGPTTFELSASRIVFDQVRLPEAFLRGFRFINAQRLPFDIEILDMSSVKTPGTDISNAPEIVVATYKNCWFTTYSTPYTADNYVITEEATMWCETAYISSPTGEFDIPNSGGARGLQSQTDTSTIEHSVNSGSRRGSLDVAGLVNSVFNK
ncbi:MAG: hypothetical protein WC523_00575 [Patescibacteria group bacterium]